MPQFEELSPEAVRVLTQARELLQRGWQQHFAHDQARDSYCLVGAVAAASDRMANGRHYPHSQQLCVILNDACGGIPQCWNDAPGRTQEDVLRLLDGILARARK